MKPIAKAEIYDRIQEVRARYGDKGDCNLLMNVFERAPGVTIQEINQMEVLLFSATHEMINPLNGGGGNCFLVTYRTDEYDKKNEVISWLEDNDYSKVYGKDYDLGYYWINIDTKKYRGSMPGVAFGTPIGGRWISFSELKEIVEILEREERVFNPMDE